VPRAQTAGRYRLFAQPGYHFRAALGERRRMVDDRQNVDA